MKAQELRIENWCNRTNKRSGEKITMQLTASCILDISSNGENSSFIYNPIPLTEEILLKCGFYKALSDFFLHESLHHGLRKSNGFYMTNVTKEIEYLHQLQNLYWCLCGEELNIKL